MKVVTTFHPSSSVVSSAKCRLTSRDLEHLVVAKLNRVDVYSLQPHGLQHECGVDVWGKVLGVKAIPLSVTASARSTFALMIGHPDPEVIFFSYEEYTDGRRDLHPKHSISLRERGVRPAEAFSDLLIHPSGKLAVAHCYAGRIKVIQLKAGQYVKDFDLGLQETTILSMAFVPTGQDDDQNYSLAILHFDPMERVQLRVRDISKSGGGDWELSLLPSAILPPTAISNNTIPDPIQDVPRLIPVPPSSPDGSYADDQDFQGGILVVGGRKLLLYELASDSESDRYRRSVERLQKKKVDPDPAQVKAAKKKENERDAKKRKPTAAVDWPCGEVTAWSDVEGAPLRFFLGDNYGALSLLSLDNVRNVGLLLIPLGIASPPTSLTYLSNQALYVGSHLGDSQLIEISNTPVPHQPVLLMPPGIVTVSRTSSIPLDRKSGKQKANDAMDVDDTVQEKLAGGRVVEPDVSYLKLVQSFKNIGPILDAVMVDTEGSGQHQLVTCSGAENSGSLNIIRNGSEYQELASIPGVVNITRIWAVKSHFEANHHTHIVASTDSQTLFYRFKDVGGQISMVELNQSVARGIVFNETTLDLANIAKRTTDRTTGGSKYADSNVVVQVVPSGVYLLEYDNVLEGYTERGKFLPADVPGARKPYEITAASVNSTQVAVAFNGGLVAVLNINDTMNGFLLRAQRLDIWGPEVSAISCIPVNTENPASAIVAVAYWSTNEVHLLAITGAKLDPIVKSPPLPALVRSLRLFNFGTSPTSKGPDFHAYLVCGLSDGSFAHFAWNQTEKILSDRKIVSLGDAPVHLTACEVGGKKAIFAAGNRATVISLDKKKLVHSPVMLKDVTATFRFNTESFANSFLLAGPHGLHIGQVLDLNKLNIKTIPLGYCNPRKIEYVPLMRKFAVGCITSEPRRVGDIESVTSVLRLYDDTTFKPTCEFKCQSREEVTSLVNFTRNVGDKEVPYICVGLVEFPGEQHRPVIGRLRIFTASAPHDGATELIQVTSVDIPSGCVYALKFVNGRIVAAVESAVELYSFIPDGPASFKLDLVSTWYNNYVVSSLGSFGDHLVTGDTIHTVSLLKVSGDKFESVARDYGPLSPVAVEALDEKHLITVNNTMNLYTFSLAGDTRKVLERDGGYHVADFVTKLIRGSMSSDLTGGSSFTPEVVFCTSSGRIGVIANVDDQDLALQLSSLQRNLDHQRQRTAVVGGDSHSKFRAPRESHGRSDGESAAYGFLDGDFLESFLGMIEDADQVKGVYAGSSGPEALTVPVEDYQRALETLQSLH